MTDRRTTILEAASRLIARRGVRGLRMHELATEAGVSTALVYYHFKDRAGALRHTLDFITDRTKRYSAVRRRPDQPSDPLQLLEQTLLLAFQDLHGVREDSTAWGELRASAVFEPELREALARAGESRIREIAGLLTLAQPSAATADAIASAERLTALHEGLNARRLSGALHPEHAGALMKEAIEIEVAHLKEFD
ncbi:TetR/AcrR family transcriptional regulator [Streptomyces sp. HUAS MG47]|uniref:TetR/AcrR family transcriptional regulator n=1 Tax=Streptomyces solicamelliae TaxID=3231716 RepID=UPI003877BEA3